MIEPGGTFESFMNRMGSIRERWIVDIVPASTEPLSHNAYAPQYAWMYATEKRLKYRIEKAIGTRLGRTERLLFGSDGVVSECLSNAFVHGNRREGSRPISVEVAVSADAVCLRIRDDGDGFDVNSVTHTAENGGAYFNYAGNGMRALRESTVTTAAYSECGAEITLLVSLR